MISTIINDVLNRTKDRFKCFVDPSTRVITNPFVKDYATGQFGLHLHLFLKTPINNFESSNFCIIVHGLPDFSMQGQFKLRHLFFRKISSCEINTQHTIRVWPIVDRDIRQWQQAMFISVIQFMKQPKGMLMRIPSMIWLQSLNKCPVGIRKVSDFSKPIAIIKRISDKDRKFCLVEGSSDLFQGKLPSHMVETATQVVSNLADDDSPFNRRGFENLDPQCALSSLLIKFRNDGTCISFVKPLNSIIQGFEVIASPNKFDSNTIQRMHKTELKHEFNRNDSTGS
jgi:hypothetical protein